MLAFRYATLDVPAAAGLRPVRRLEYKDADGDWIAVSGDEELREAVELYDEARCGGGDAKPIRCRLVRCGAEATAGDAAQPCPAVGLKRSSEATQASGGAPTKRQK